MRRIFAVLSLVVAWLACSALARALVTHRRRKVRRQPGGETLTDEELQGIIDAAVAAAEQTTSLLRVDAQGTRTTNGMHIAIVDRNGTSWPCTRWRTPGPISIDIALAKAYTAAGLSSDENAISSRSIGFLTQPGGAPWNVGNSNDPGTGDDSVEERGLIEFPGGLPLYKNGCSWAGSASVATASTRTKMWPRPEPSGMNRRRSFGSTVSWDWRGPTPTRPHRARGPRGCRQQPPPPSAGDRYLRAAGVRRGVAG